MNAFNSGRSVCSLIRVLWLLALGTQALVTAPAAIAPSGSVPNPHKAGALCPKDRSLDIVLSRHHEDTTAMAEWLEQLVATKSLAGLTYCIHLFDKGPDELPAVMASLPAIDYFTKLPNLAREGHSYLTYIITQWEDMPLHVLFSQAVPNGLNRNMLSRIHLFKRECTRFLCLGSIATCGCDGCNFPFRMTVMREIWMMAQHDRCTKPFEACTEGQFIVARPTIRRHRLRAYKMLLNTLVAGPDDIVHQDFLLANATGALPPILPEDEVVTLEEFDEARFDGDNVYFGHVLERMWSPMFDCYSADTSMLRAAWDLVSTGQLQKKQQHCEHCGLGDREHKGKLRALGERCRGRRMRHCQPDVAGGG
uniref:Hexosyltransferase n=1 Tax=Chlamydomonas leiostraca TaxID=1034604 RepID=A0A7S0S2L0_9CHLO|mmetsp:Transcript_4641/g.11454  ORF Transcript_4641/g.11454 Transcript_4641/m.11454 type:complete len:365 (+) Transcript_4641:100-1194(+)